MKLPLTEIKWLRVVVSSFLVVIVSFLVVTIITAGYAFILALEAHGKPDQVAINHFAGSLSLWFMPLLEMFLTFLVAMISTRKVEKSISIHGFLIGLLAGSFGVILKLCYGGQVTYRTIVFFLIVIGLGFIGGYLSQWRSAKNI